MDTLWMLTGRYEGLPIVPVDRVVADFFQHMSSHVFLRKVADGSLPLPVVRMGEGQKAAKGIHVRDLADYIDQRHEDALRDHKRMHH